jgi:hypothetical protein
MHEDELHALRGRTVLHSDDVPADSLVQPRLPTARKVGGPLAFIRDLLYRKYPQYPREAAISPTDSVVVEVTPTRVFSWGFD